MKIYKYIHATIFALFAPILFLHFTDAAGQTNAEISGQVVNATRDSAAVREIAVDLFKVQSTMETPSLLSQGKTLRDGTFHFQTSAMDSNTALFAAVDYLGVRYYSQPAAATGQEENFQHRVVVYDTIQKADNITVLMHHLFAQDRGKNLELRETRIMENPTRHALINSAGDRATFHFPLPAAAQNFTPPPDLMPDELIMAGNRIYDKGIALPGSKQISYSYEIPWIKNSVDLHFNIEYPTNSFDFFISDPAISIESTQMNDHGSFTIRGHDYHRYGASEIQKSTSIQLVIRRSRAMQESPYLTIVMTASLLLAGLLIYAVQNKKAGMNP